MLSLNGQVDPGLPDVCWEQGTLSIDDSQTNVNTITVSTAGDMVQVNGVSFAAAALVQRIDVQAGPGDDLVDLTSLTSANLSGVQIEIDGGDGDDVLLGSPYDDEIWGRSGDDVLDGHGGDRDHLDGGVGNDEYRIDNSSARTVRLIDFHLAARQFNTVNFAAADDPADGADFDLRPGQVSQVFANVAVEVVQATNTPVGATLNTRIHHVIGTDFDDVVRGNRWVNQLDGRDGDDWLEGRDGDDLLVGGSGDDRLEGGAGRDGLRGGTGTLDVLVGGGGHDEYWVDNHSAQTVRIVDLGLPAPHQNTINLSEANDPDDGAFLDLRPGQSSQVFAEVVVEIPRFDDTPLGATLESHIQHVVGTDFDDVLIGNRFANTLYGRAGDDQLFGSDGADQLFGGFGNDSLSGEAGDDALYGGAGLDEYFADPAAHNLDDLILDSDQSALLLDSRPPNTPVNRPPAIAPIAEQFVRVGRELVVSLDVYDPDLSLGQSLSYLPGDGFPSTADLDSHGVFRWTPSSSTDRTVEIVVVDSGAPALEDRVTFEIVVDPPLELPPLGVHVASVQSASVDIAWPLIERAESYDVQRRLFGRSWSTVATGLSVPSLIDDDVAPGGRYGYRVRANYSTGPSSYSTAVDAVAPLPAPAGLRAENLQPDESTADVQLDWEYSLDDSNALAVEFVIERANRLNDWQEVATPSLASGTTRRLANDLGSTVQFYRVAARTGTNESEYVWSEYSNIAVAAGQPIYDEKLGDFYVARTSVAAENLGGEPVFWHHDENSESTLAEAFDDGQSESILADGIGWEGPDVRFGLRFGPEIPNRLGADLVLFNLQWSIDEYEVQRWEDDGAVTGTPIRFGQSQEVADYLDRFAGFVGAEMGEPTEGVVVAQTVNIESLLLGRDSVGGLMVTGVEDEGISSADPLGIALARNLVGYRIDLATNQARDRAGREELLVPLNNNFDEGNNDDGSLQPDNHPNSQIVAGDRQLTPVALRLMSNIEVPGTYELEFDNDTFRVWTDRDAGWEEVIDGEENPVTIGGPDDRIDLWIEGIESGQSSLKAKFNPDEDAYDAYQHTAELYVTVAELDLDLDADNDGDIDAADDTIEDDPDQTGRWLIRNVRDYDEDGVPSYADGLTMLPDDEGDVDVGPSDEFPYALVELRLPASDLDDDSALIRFSNVTAESPELTDVNEIDAPLQSEHPLRLWHAASTDFTPGTSNFTVDRDPRAAVPPDSASSEFGSWIPGQTWFKLADLKVVGAQTKRFYLEGLSVSDEAGGSWLQVDVAPMGDVNGPLLSDRVRTTVIEVNASFVPSHNEAPSPAFVRDDREEAPADAPLVLLNGGNADEVDYVDGASAEVNHDFFNNDPALPILDAFDGYQHASLQPSQAATAASANFMQLELELSRAIDLTDARIQFSYDDAQPGSATSDDLTPHTGAMRIWTVDGNALRLAETVAEGGHLVASQVWYSAADLGIDPQTRLATLFVEGVNPADRSNSLRVEVDPDGAGGSDFRATDVIRAMVANFVVEGPAEVSADDHQGFATVQMTSLTDAEVKLFDGEEIRFLIYHNGLPLETRTATLDAGDATIIFGVSTIAGDAYVVDAKFHTHSVLTQPWSIVAGDPASIDLTSSHAEIVADETGQFTITAVVRDQFGNLVEDGTNVGWQLIEGATRQLDGQPTPSAQTAGGVAAVTLRAPSAPGPQTIVVTAGSVRQTIVVTGVAASVALNGPAALDLDAGEVAAMTLTANVADGTPVFWTMSNGDPAFAESAVAGGAATLPIAAAGPWVRPGKSFVTATVAGQLVYHEIDITTSAPFTITLDRNVLSGDEVANGAELLTFENLDATYDGAPIWGFTPPEQLWPAPRLVDFFAETAVQLQGNPNQLYFPVLEGGNQLLLEFDNLAPGGHIELDATGQGVFTVRSRGALSESAVFDMVEASFTVLEGTSDPTIGAPERSQRLALVHHSAWTRTWDAAQAFVGGDPETAAGIGANIAGGMLIVGDVGALVKNGWRMTPLSEADPNYVEASLSGLGLLTELAVGAGEAADAPLSAVKAIVAASRGSKLSKVLTILAKRGISNAQDLASLGRFLVRIGSHDSVFTLAKTLFSSEELLASGIRISDEFGPLTDDLLESVANKASSALGNVGTAQDIVQLLGRLPVESLQYFKSLSGPQLDQAIERLSLIFLTGKIDIAQMEKLLNNDHLYTAAYDQLELLKDLAVVADAEGVGKLVNYLQGAKINGPIHGRLYELQTSARLVADNPNAKVKYFAKFTEEIDSFTGRVTGRTDIDFVIDDGVNTIYYQAKTSKAAFGKSKALAIQRAKSWVRLARNDISTNAITNGVVRYITPDPAQVPDAVRQFLAANGIPIAPSPLNR